MAYAGAESWEESHRACAIVLLIGLGHQGLVLDNILFIVLQCCHHLCIHNVDSQSGFAIQDKAGTLTIAEN